MSFVNDIASNEKVDTLEISGDITVGGDIHMIGVFPKIEQKLTLKTDVLTTTALNTNLSSAINLKANQADMEQIETDINTTLDTKANQTGVDTAMALKANQTDVNTSLGQKANQSDVNTAMALKANQTDVDTLLGSKANTTDMNAAMALKANQTDVNTAMALKANQTDVDTSLGSKANTTDMNTAMALKANQADIENLATQANLTDVNTTVVSHTASLASHDGLIQGLYDADYASISLVNNRNYATEGWVNDKDYATESFVTSSVVSGSAISVLIDVALQGTATTAQVTAANQATSDVLDNLTTNYVPRPADWNILSSPDGLNSYVEEKVLADGTIVRKPDDWSTYPSGNFGALPPTLRSYTDGKLNEVQEGIQSYMKLRDYSWDANNNRIGETRIEFLRTNPNENFGLNHCADWRIGANSTCGFDIYRKATHPNLGSIYDGNVLELEDDGDVNIPKVGGLKINGDEVATKTYTDTTFATIGVEASVSDLSTASSSHGLRLTSIEDAGYATTSQLSTYATASSLGTTNDTVGGINTRVNTLETSGFITSAGLSGYDFATEGYVASAIPDVSNFVNSSTLSTNHYTKTETDTAISNAGGSSSQADTVNIQSFDTGDTDNYLVFTKDSSAGYKGLFEDSALKYDATNNKLTAGELKCDTLHFIDALCTAETNSVRFPPASSAAPSPSPRPR